MSPEDRKALGLRTLEEDMKRLVIKSEKELQNQIVAYANIRGIEMFRQRMDKKTTTKKGTPDLFFCAMCNGFPRGVAIETKYGSGTCTRDQNDMHARMKTRPNAWDVRVIRTFIEVVDLFRELGL
jgi:hypothetical protein